MKFETRRVVATSLVLGLALAACGGDDDEPAADEPAAEEPAADEPAAEPADDMEEPAEEPADDMDEPADDMDEPADDMDEPAADGSPIGVEGVLAGVCPELITVQTDWFPESEHGAIYNLIGDDYTVDANAQTTTGSLISAGVDTGVDFQVRAGGPAIGFSPTAVVTYADDSITMAYANTEAQVIQFDDTPMVSVMAPLEINPQMIMWDPETYPDVETLADLGEAGATINYFAGGEFMEVFISEGVVSRDQVDPSYDGSPARFIADGGATAQQGFASAEPYNYENVFEEWARPVAFELLHDTGFEVYAATIAVRAAQLEELSPCLELFVPILQQATVDFYNDPDRTNAMIIDAVETINSFWVYDQGIADFSVQTQIDLGLAGNGDDDTVGNIDGDRIQRVIDQIQAAGLETADVTADDLFTNEFIDESIGF